MPVRTLQLGAVVNPAAGVNVTVYTCPAGSTAIVKHMSVALAGANTATVEIVRGVAAHRLVEITSGPAGLVSSEDLWAVLEPGDVLRARWTLGGATSSLWASGAQLSGVV